MGSPATRRHQSLEPGYLSLVFKKLGGRYKRIRRRVKGKPDKAIYDHKKQVLAQLETLSKGGLIDLFYSDESHVCSEGYVPYGWQFPDEEVFIAAQKGFRLNCWAMINRQNVCYSSTTEASITADFVAQELDKRSLAIVLPTVVVLDNASVHTAKVIQQRRAVWESRGLYLFWLPTYSPHLNIAETLWRHLKGGWLRPQDYGQADDLAYAVNRCLANVGIHLKIEFSDFNET